MRSTVLASLVALVFVGVSGCDFGSSPDRGDLARLEAEILIMIGDAQATDVSFCREIAFGSKPCGGPWKYLAYSTASTDSVALKAKVDRYNRWEREINERDGGVSDCMFVGPPGVELVGGQCRLKSN